MITVFILKVYTVVALESVAVLGEEAYVVVIDNKQIYFDVYEHLSYLLWFKGIDLNWDIEALGSIQTDGFLSVLASPASGAEEETYLFISEHPH